MGDPNIRDTQDPTRPSFEAVWPDVAARLRCVLGRAGAPSWIAEDLTQETAVRALTKWDELETSEPLLPWAITVARNLLVDHHRAATKLVAEEPREDASVIDVEEVALTRLELTEVRRALERLHPRYRAALLAEVGEAPQSAASRFARNSARMRARRQLLAILHSVRGVAVVAPATLRRLRQALYLKVAKTRNTSAFETLAQSAAGVCLVAALLLAGDVTPALGGPATGEISRSVGASGSASSMSRQSGRDIGSSPGLLRSRGGTLGRIPPAPPAHPSGGLNGATLGQLPAANGGTSNLVVVGAEGYDITNEGSQSFEGESASWKQRHRFDTPDCVEDVAAGQAPGPCDSKGAAGYVEAEAAGRKYRVDYDV